MHCPECPFEAPYNEAPTLSSCVICNVPLIPTAQDILEHKMFSIVKEVRPAQVQMAQDIEALFKLQNGSLLAEGQTGTGKSFAYLIPALLREDKRIIISTDKKALQDQLYKKDLPLLCAKLGIPTNSYGIYKGRSNYLCRRLLKEVPYEDKKDCETFLAKYNNRPADKADWPTNKPLLWWSKAHADDCADPEKCPHSAYCVPKPRDYRVVVTNHSLVGIDLHLNEIPGSILGSFDTLILDEAHQAAKSFQDAFTNNLKVTTIQRLVKRLKYDDSLHNYLADTNVVKRKLLLNTANTLLLATEQTHKQALSALDGNKRIVLPAIHKQIQALQTDAENFRSKLVLIQHRLLRDQKTEQKRDETMLQHPLVGLLPDLTTTEERDTVRLLAKVNRYIATTKALIGFCAGIDEEDPTTQVISANELGIMITPLSLGPIIRPRLEKIPHRVFTSATLAIGTEFTQIIKDLGVPTDQPTTAKVYESPFRVKNRTLLYLPQHLPLPVHANKSPAARKNWINASAGEMARLMEAVRGDTFVLFTSRSDMQEHLNKLNHDNFWKRSGITLCAQEQNTAATFNKFMTTPNSVLFGLKTFWEGIDVPGPKLKLVIIPKLPFPLVSDPLLRAKQELIDREKGRPAGFHEIAIPLMITDMRQGIGRLIRTSYDCGFIAVLDGRVWTATSSEELHRKRIMNFQLHPQVAKRTGYAKRLLDAIGLPNQTNKFEDVTHWANRWFKLDCN